MVNKTILVVVPVEMRVTISDSPRMKLREVWHDLKDCFGISHSSFYSSVSTNRVRMTFEEFDKIIKSKAKET